MTVSIIGTHGSDSIGTETSLTYEHTVPEGAAAIAVSVETRNGPITGITWGGVALTRAVRSIVGGVEASIWYLTNPADGTADIVVTASNASAGIVMGVTNLADVDRVNPVRDTATGNGSTIVSLSVDTEAGDLVIDSLAGPDNGTGDTPTIGAGQTQLHGPAIVTDTRGRSSWEAATGSSVTMSWTTLRSENWRYVAVSFKSPVEPDPGLYPEDDTEVIAAGHGFIAADEGQPAVPMSAALRFASVDLPQGADISQATLTLTVSTVGGNPDTTCYGLAVDDLEAFADPGNLPSAIARTTASQPFAPNNSGSVGINVTTILQEIVNRAGWESGNALGFVFEDEVGSGENYWQAVGYSAATTPRMFLDITWVPGAWWEV